jgi:hypothetical protein
VKKPFITAHFRCRHACWPSPENADAVHVLPERSVRNDRTLVFRRFRDKKLGGLDIAEAFQ